jgi:hypothetical protein
MKDLALKKTRKLLKMVPSGSKTEDKDTDWIYVIGLNNADKEFAQKLISRLQRARNRAKDYSKLNAENANSRILYVGRSKRPRSRLNQHLGAGSHGVYALHLGRWARQIGAEIFISYMRFERQDNLLVQAIEDGLWLSLRPLFGRKGEK